MNIIDIVSTLVGFALSFELGRFLPFNERLDTRSDRRTRRIFFFVALAASGFAASIIHTHLDVSYIFSIVITLFIFFVIYRIAKNT